MPSARFQPAFTSGVLGPALWGRVDLQKYDSALRQGINVIVHSHGGAYGYDASVSTIQGFVRMTDDQGVVRKVAVVA